MASSNVPADSQAHIAKCTLCDRDTDARFFCTNCNEDMCKQCKTTHLRSKATRNHNVISSAEDKDTSTHGAKINCTIHKHDTVQMYCINCEALVCHTCIAGKHKNHAFDKLLDVTVKHKKKISGHLTSIKREIQGMETSLKSLEANKKAYIKDADDVVDNINKKREEWKSQADTIADGLIQQVHDYKCNDLQQIDKQYKQIQDLISEKEHMLKRHEEITQSDNPDSIIKCATNIQYSDKASPLPIYAISPRFVNEGMVDLTDIFSHVKIEKENVQKSTFKPQDVNLMKNKTPKADETSGKSFTIDKTVVAEFKHKQRVAGISAIFKSKQKVPKISKISGISVIGDKHAWVNEFAGNNVTLVDTGGNVIKNVPLDIQVYDIKATTQSEIFITEFSGHEIRKYNKDGKCVTIADMSPLYPHGLCITSDDDLLVCLWSVTGDNKVVRMTINGNVKQTIQYDQHKQPLYRNPSLVTENINGDVCVVDGYSSNTVVVVNKDIDFRFRYPHGEKSSYTIQKCHGIACDKLGFILISDFTNNQIHQIDIDGQFVQCVFTEKDGIYNPLGLNVDTEGKLWICNDDGGKVKIVKYRS